METDETDEMVSVTIILPLFLYLIKTLYSRLKLQLLDCTIFGTNCLRFISANWGLWGLFSLGCIVDLKSEKLGRVLVFGNFGRARNLPKPNRVRTTGTEHFLSLFT